MRKYIIFIFLISTYILQATPKPCFSSKNLKWGLVDEDNKIFIKPKFDSKPIIRDNESSVLKADCNKTKEICKYSLLSKDGNFKDLSEDITSVDRFNNGLALAKKNEKYGFINIYGEFQIEPIFDHLSNFSEGLCNFRKDNIRGYINENGKIEKILAYPFIFDFKDGFATVCTDRLMQCGLINRKFETIVTPSYNQIYSFKSDLALFTMEINDQTKCFGYLNRKGEIEIPCKFLDASSFHGDTAYACNAHGLIFSNKKCGLIDKKGNFKNSKKYSDIIIEDGYLIAKNDNLFRSFFNMGNYGVIDFEGKILIPFIYDEIIFFSPYKENSPLLLKRNDQCFSYTLGSSIEPSECGEKRSLLVKQFCPN